MNEDGSQVESEDADSDSSEAREETPEEDKSGERNGDQSESSSGPPNSSSEHTQPSSRPSDSSESPPGEASADDSPTTGTDTIAPGSGRSTVEPATAAQAEGSTTPDAETEAFDGDTGEPDDERTDGERTESEQASDHPTDDAADERSMPGVPEPDEADEDAVPTDVQKYARFQKMDGAQYDRVNEFLRDRTYITAREWAIARLCSDFRTETGVEMTKIGENLPELVPFMTDTYTPQAVNQARSSFEDKIRTAGATFLYGAMCDFFTAEELDDVMYESTEVAKFLLEVEGVDLSVEEELEAEERISSVMRDVRDASQELREDEA